MASIYIFQHFTFWSSLCAEMRGRKSTPIDGVYTRLSAGLFINSTGSVLFPSSFLIGEKNFSKLPNLPKKNSCWFIYFVFNDLGCIVFLCAQLIRVVNETWYLIFKLCVEIEFRVSLRTRKLLGQRHGMWARDRRLLASGIYITVTRDKDV
jgi:hypothetical protein